MPGEGVGDEYSPGCAVAASGGGRGGSTYPVGGCCHPGATFLLCEGGVGDECSDASVPVWGQEPTLAQATAYYRDSDASATRGVLTPADCGHIEYQAPDGATMTLDLTGDDEQRAFTLGDSGGELQDQLSFSDDGRVLAIGDSVLIDLTTGQYMDFADSAPDRPALIAPALMLTKTDTNLTATAPR